MKKIKILILSFLLLATNFSGALSMHYCHGEPYQFKVEIFNVQKTFNKKLDCCCHIQNLNRCCYNQSYDEIFSTKIIVSEEEHKSLNNFTFLLSKKFGFNFIQITANLNKTTLFYAKQANSPPLYKLFSTYILYA